MKIQLLQMIAARLGWLIALQWLLIIVVLVSMSGCATSQPNYDKVISHANSYFVACVAEAGSEACSAENYARVESIKQQAITARARKRAILYYQDKRRRSLINSDINGDMSVGSELHLDAYGLGVHMDQFGRPVTVVPAY